MFVILAFFGSFFALLQMIIYRFKAIACVRTSLRLLSTVQNEVKLIDLSR